MPFGFLMFLPPLFKQHNPKVPSDTLTRTPDVYPVLKIQLLAIMFLCQENCEVNTHITGDWATNGEWPLKKKKKEKGATQPSMPLSGKRLPENIWRHYVCDQSFPWLKGRHKAVGPKTSVHRTCSRRSVVDSSESDRNVSFTFGSTQPDLTLMGRNCSFAAKTSSKHRREVRGDHSEEFSVCQMLCFKQRHLSVLTLHHGYCLESSDNLKESGPTQAPRRLEGQFRKGVESIARSHSLFFFFSSFPDKFHC